MSIEVTNKVWLRGPQDAKQRLLLMAIADHANEKGAAYPGMELLAQKSCQSVRNAVRAIQQLEREGWIMVLRRKHGERARGNEYLINLARLGDEKEAETGNHSRSDTVSPREENRVANTPTCDSPSDKLSLGKTYDENAVHEVTKPRHEVTKQGSRSDKMTPCIENRKEPSIEPLHPPTPRWGDARNPIPDELEDVWRGHWELRNRLDAPLGKPPIPWERFRAGCLEQLERDSPPKPAPDPEFEACASAREAANTMMRRCSLIGNRLGSAIAAAIDAAAALEVHGGVGELGETACRNFMRYQREAGWLRYTWGPRKFFTEGHWLTPDSWPREKQRAL